MGSLFAAARCGRAPHDGNFEQDTAGASPPAFDKGNTLATGKILKHFSVFHINSEFFRFPS